MAILIALLVAAAIPQVAMSNDESALTIGSIDNTNIATLVFVHEQPAEEGPAIVLGESKAQEADRLERERIAQLYEKAAATPEEREENREIARLLISDLLGAQHWPAAEELLRRESGFNHRAKNPSSGACGLPQALPCSKLAAYGEDEPMAREAQVMWFITYVVGRYGSMQAALAHHNLKNWY